ncbi:MAG: MurR/RpiR family transcriptional regulator [Chloroflexota bacterium]
MSIVYREKIREYYDHLSRSYRKVADFIMSNYYEVAFMTAAQLAYAVGVDTTTVVRFSQRLGFNGYPELLSDIRGQVKAEIYAAYEPKELDPDDPEGTFKDRTDQEQSNLKQMLVHNPPEQIHAVANMITAANHIILISEGYAETVAEMAAQQLRHRGVSAEMAPDEPVKRAATLMNVKKGTLVVGISATKYGDAVAKALEFSRSKGCATLGIVGSLASPVNRLSDLVLYAPTDVAGPLPSIVALVSALAALVQIASKDSAKTVDRQVRTFNNTYRFLTEGGASNSQGSE